jgi:tRNA (guanine37-N1)-methyltransferase
MPMKSPCIAVPLKSGEEVRKALLDKGKLNKELKLNKNEEFLYLPIICEKGMEDFLGYKVLDMDFEELEVEVKSYKELIEIPDDLMEILPTSFDVVGKVAIIKIPDEIEDYKEKIGAAILDSQKNLETVAEDLGVEGEERVRKLEIIVGEKRTETVHKEYGIELKIDPSLVYFSPRLATEHWRVAQMVRDDEVVIDMFCGAGPFAILIVKNKNPKKIHAIDVNEKAIEFLKQNIERNRVTNIVAYVGDSKVIVTELEPADRIIMNLPHTAFEFLDVALMNVKNGGVIHYYEILANNEKEKRFEEIKDSRGKGVFRISLLALTEVHTYSPDLSLFCFDLKVEKDEGNI